MPALKHDTEYSKREYSARENWHSLFDVFDVYTLSSEIRMRSKVCKELT